MVAIRLLCHSYLDDNVVHEVSQCGESLTDEGGLGEKLLWKDVFPWKLIYDVPIELDEKINPLIWAAIKLNFLLFYVEVGVYRLDGS